MSNTSVLRIGLAHHRGYLSSCAFKSTIVNHRCSWLGLDGEVLNLILLILGRPNGLTVEFVNYENRRLPYVLDQLAHGKIDFIGVSMFSESSALDNFTVTQGSTWSDAVVITSDQSSLDAMQWDMYLRPFQVFQLWLWLMIGITILLISFAFSIDRFVHEYEYNYGAYPLNDEIERHASIVTIMSNRIRTTAFPFARCWMDELWYGASFILNQDTRDGPRRVRWRLLTLCLSVIAYCVVSFSLLTTLMLPYPVFGFKSISDVTESIHSGEFKLVVVEPDGSAGSAPFMFTDWPDVSEVRSSLNDDEIIVVGNQDQLVNAVLHENGLYLGFDVEYARILTTLHCDLKMQILYTNKHYYTAFPYNPANKYARALADTLLLEQSIVAHVERRAKLVHELQTSCSHDLHHHAREKMTVGNYTALSYNSVGGVILLFVVGIGVSLVYFACVETRLFSRLTTYNIDKRGSIATRSISGMSAINAEYRLSQLELGKFDSLSPAWRRRKPKVSFNQVLSFNPPEHNHDEMAVEDDVEEVDHPEDVVRSRRRMSERRMSVKDYWGDIDM